MPVLFRRQSNVSCFFCQSGILPIPQNLRSFRCPHCGCWNRYDEKGEIMSDEPAMHDESLNLRSFAKRASPSKDRLPTVYGKGPFCHTCQTNQMLFVNLLSNYLPPSDVGRIDTQHPEYTQRLEKLPEYRESLHFRYPSVCASCLPSVEEEIRNKDHMARTRALGALLKESKIKGKRRQVSATTTEGKKIGGGMYIWRIRGCLWIGTLTLALLGNFTGALGARPPRNLAILQPALPTLALVSILWTIWDHTYSSLRNARLQGRDVRQRGKNEYIMLQVIAWLSRLLTSVHIGLFWFRPHCDYLHLSHYPPSARSRVYFSVSFAIELSILVASFVVLRLQQPPPIRLIDTNSHKPSSARQTPEPSAPTNLPEPDLLAALSLSSKPVMSPPNPVFGVPSLISTLPSSSAQGNNTPHDTEPDADAMDWTPTNPPLPSDKGKHKAVDNDGLWLRPQTFFPPEQPTGLEGLFARTRLADDTDSHTVSHRDRNGPRVWKWWWVYLISLVPFAGAVYKAWESRDKLSTVMKATRPWP